MSKTVFAYYESIPGSNQPEEFACANMWKGSWEYHNWKCQMLNKSHASSSPLYAKLLAKMIKDNLRGAQLSRFTRWCALHAAGGGWMSDYDVLNLGFSLSKALEIEALHPLQLVAGDRSYIFYATKEKAEEVIRKLIDESLLVDGLPRPEYEIYGKAAGDLSEALGLLMHARGDEETTKSQRMAARLSE